MIHCGRNSKGVYEEFIKLLSDKEKEGYNYIFYVNDGRKDEHGLYLNSYILTFSAVRHVSDIKSQNYFQIDDKFSDLIDFLEPDFWYAYCLKNDRILDVVR